MVVFLMYEQLVHEEEITKGQTSTPLNIRVEELNDLRENMSLKSNLCCHFIEIQT